MKQVLLTGIGGSIGIHTLVHLMHKTDWEVVGIDSFRHRGWFDRINEQRKEHPEWNDRYRIITHDMTAPFSELTKKNIGHVDFIISMASLSDVEASIHDPVTFIHNNVMLTTHLLEYAREVRPEMFIVFSTDEVYGPTPGKSDGYPEWAPLVPSNPYAASKACQEMVAIAYWRTYNVPVVITNTMNNFGEMQSASKFPVIIQKAISKDETVVIHGDAKDLGSRSYIHSRNCSDALLFIMQNIKPHLHVAGEADKPTRLHIAGDKQLDNLELAQAIARLMGKELKYEIVDFHQTRPGHDRHYGLDDSKIRNLGWKSPVSFEESLKHTIEWQQNHPKWL